MPAMDLPAQKGFYDSKRSFQGKDDPRTEPVGPTLRPDTSRPPVGQVIAGLIFLGLIVLAFLAFALPEKPVGDAPPPAAPAKPAH
jgi:hypothetical protein